MKGWWVDCNLEKIYLGAKIKLERRGFTQLEEFERTSAIRTVKQSFSPERGEGVFRPSVTGSKFENLLQQLP